MFFSFLFSTNVSYTHQAIGIIHLSIKWRNISLLFPWKQLSFLEPWKHSSLSLPWKHPESKNHNHANTNVSIVAMSLLSIFEIRHFLTCPSNVDCKDWPAFWKINLRESYRMTFLFHGFAMKIFAIFLW